MHEVISQTDVMLIELSKFVLYVIFLFYSDYISNAMSQEDKVMFSGSRAFEQSLCHSKRVVSNIHKLRALFLVKVYP